MNPIHSQGPFQSTPRERRVSRLSLWMGWGGGGVALLGAIAAAIGRARNLPVFTGLGAGVLAALPLFFAVMTVLSIRQMDE
jgi:hypothetical protein